MNEKDRMKNLSSTQNVKFNDKLHELHDRTKNKTREDTIK